MNPCFAIVIDDLTKIGGAENLAVWMYLACRDRINLKFFYRSCQKDLWSDTFLSHPAVQSYKYPEYVDKSISRLGSATCIYAYGKLLKRLFIREEITHVISMTPYTSFCVSAAKKYGAPFFHFWYCHEPSRSAYFWSTDRYLCQSLNNRIEVGKELEQYFTKRIQQINSSKNRKIRKRMKKALPCIDFILTNSHYTSQSVKQAFNRESEAVYPGIPLPAKEEKFAKNSEDCSLPYIGILAPKRPEKNLYNIVRAFIQLKKDTKIKPVLRIAGSGKWEQGQALFELCSGENVHEYVKLEGFLSEEERRRFIDKSLFMMYLPLDEPFGIVPFEVLARKKPVLISNHGGMSEVLQHEKNCLKVDPLSCDEIKEGVLHYLEQPVLRDQISLCGQITVRDVFSLDALGNRLVKVLEKQIIPRSH